MISVLMRVLSIVSFVTKLFTYKLENKGKQHRHLIVSNKKKLKINEMSINIFIVFSLCFPLNNFTWSQIKIKIHNYVQYVSIIRELYAGHKLKVSLIIGNTFISPVSLPSFLCVMRSQFIY